MVPTSLFHCERSLENYPFHSFNSYPTWRVGGGGGAQYRGVAFCGHPRELPRVVKNHTSIGQALDGVGLGRGVNRAFMMFQRNKELFSKTLQALLNSQGGKVLCPI